MQIEIVKNMKKQTKGITLVALAVTIIVLLILAGITISLTIGKDGIIRRAQVARNIYQEAAQNENTQFEEFSNTSDNIIGNITGGGTTSVIDPSILALKTGDYVKYDSGENGMIMCRVLYPATSEYGLQILSEDMIEMDLGGVSSWEDIRAKYNSWISDLNDVAEGYINPVYAYDARSVGSLPTVSGGMFVDKDKHNGESGTLLIQDSLPLPTGWTNRDTGCYKSDTNYETDVEQMRSANMMHSSYDIRAYSIPSRLAVSENGWWYLSLRYISNKIQSDMIYYYEPELGLNNYWDSLSTNLIRPCFLLKADAIRIASGTGEADYDPYYLEVKTTEGES